MSCKACVRVWALEKEECHSCCLNDNGREVEFVDLREFLPRVRLVARGVPEEIALEYLGQSALDFARKTHLLKRKLRFNTQVGVRDYYLKTGELEQIFLVLADTCAVRPCAVSATSCPEFAFEPPNKIMIHHQNKIDEYYFQVNYLAIPRQDACAVDKLLFDSHQEAIVSGALANLLLMRQYEFSDVSLAVVYEQKFNKAVHQAKNDVARGFNTSVKNFNTWRKI